MRITFGTNTLDRAVRPARYPRDPRQSDYLKVHQALSAGVLKGYFSETIITLEGVQNCGRIQVFSGTQTTMREIRPYRSEDGENIMPAPRAENRARVQVSAGHRPESYQPAACVNSRHGWRRRSLPGSATRFPKGQPRETPPVPTYTLRNRGDAGSRGLLDATGFSLRTIRFAAARCPPGADPTFVSPHAK
jgi:hypothetical protein